MFILESLIVVFIMFLFTLGFAAVLTVVDRRESSMIQDRIGPNRANLSTSTKDLDKKGWLHTKLFRLGVIHVAADAIKMMVKEDFLVKENKWLHRLAPIFAFAPALMILSIIPFGGETNGGFRFQILKDFDSGILFAFAFSGLGIYGLAVAGWASNNKFSLLGSIRGAAQMISYEVALGLSLMGIFLIFGSLELNTIVQGQQSLVNGQPDLIFGIFPKWGIFVQPFAMFLYLAAATAETKRAPFDVPEAESELVAGFFTEYGSMKMGLFLFGEYIEVIVFSMMFTTFFLGGYNLPFLYSDGIHIAGNSFLMNGTLVAILQVFVFFAKVIMVAWGHLVIRWTLPRFRYDQVMHLGWKMLFPAALVNMVVTAIILVIIG